MHRSLSAAPRHPRPPRAGRRSPAPRRSWARGSLGAGAVGLALLVILPATAAGQAGTSEAPLTDHAPDSLWLRAVELAGRNQHWVPGLIVQRVEELDGELRPKHADETWLRLFLDAAGEVDQEIIKALDDEQDVTEKRQQELAREKEKRAEEDRRAEERARREAGEEKAAAAEEPGAGSGHPGDELTVRFGGDTPFEPQLQDQVVARRVEAENPPAGGPYVAYHYSQRIDDPAGDGNVLRGIAWIDPATGVPVEIRFAPDPLPKRVKEMEMIVRFGLNPSGAWVATEMTAYGMGKFLFFKKRFRTTMTFREHWWMDPDREVISND